MFAWIRNTLSLIRNELLEEENKFRMSSEPSVQLRPTGQRNGKGLFVFVKFEGRLGDSIWIGIEAHNPNT